MQYLFIFYGLLALSFLVFIHELGHYWVARMQGMRVLVFSVGFGPALFSWWRKEIEYRVGVIPFGGYVKIAGMDEDSTEEGSFFEKPPRSRLMVVLAGPIVNIAFAFCGFTALYFMGGTLKNVVEYSNIVGMVDPKSQVYKEGVRPGDRIEKINGQTIHGSRELLMQAVVDHPKNAVEGESIDYTTGKRTPFSFVVDTEKKPLHGGIEIFASGLESPACYLLLDASRSGEIVDKKAPIAEQNLKDHDRLIWVNGELIFSREQLSNLLQEKNAFLTVLRDHQVLHIKVPKISLSTLNLAQEEKEELNDLRFDARLSLIQDAEVLPYLFDQEGLVIGLAPRIAGVADTEVLAAENLLHANDRILAVDGVGTRNGGEIMAALQKKRVVTIFANSDYAPLKMGTVAENFYKEVQFTDLDRLVNQIGISNGSLNGSQVGEETIGNLRRLPPVELMSSQDNGETKYRLGLFLLDRQIIVNPTPFTKCAEVVHEMKSLLGHLVKGDLSPKCLSGPVGIVSAMQKEFSDGFQQGLTLLSMISLNLGLFNLLPLPVLDGGHAVLSLFEMVTRRRISRQWMERILIPFALLLIGFALFTTFHDLARLFF